MKRPITIPLALLVAIDEDEKEIRAFREMREGFDAIYSDWLFYGDEWRTKAPQARAAEQARRDLLFGVTP